MGSLHNSVETVTAAATAIVSAESRVQPSSTPRTFWGRCWRIYWCFGSQKSNKKIIHAVVPESTVAGITASSAEPIPSTTIVMPFIAPPSSPAVQSVPPSATQSPAGKLSVASLAVNAYSHNGPVSIFTIGPYAYETQLVSPPVFSTFTTEPSTACFTPPPEAVQLTTPSSPEVPFAQLLTSSLERSRRNSGINNKFSWSHYEYQQYPGSPGAQLISPGSAISTSGTSTPFYDRRCIVEVRVGETPKILSFEHFSTHKWCSGHGSGSLTPDGAGLGSRLGSGCLTPDGVGSVSRQSSGWVTPDALGKDSRLGSGCLTPASVGSKTQEIRTFENQIYEAAPLSDPEDRCQSGAIVDHRVSFELTGEDVARCFANKSVASSTNVSGSSQDMFAESEVKQEGLPDERNNPRESCSGEISVQIPGNDLGESENQCSRQHLSVSLGSSKEFNFDNSKTDVSNNPNHGPRWWANNKVIGEEAKPGNSWSFFPIMQADVS